MGRRRHPDPDVRLMLDVGADRAGAFEELVTRFTPLLAAFVHRQVGDAGATEDLVQEVFLRVYRTRKRYRPEARLKAWLLRIATNLCLNRRRYERCRPHLSLDAGRSGGEEGVGAALADGRVPEPSRRIERSELAARVRRAVQELPPNQRLAVSLLRFEGLSYQEIAGVMGLSLQAVKSLLNRAKANLRALLAPEIAGELAVEPPPAVHER